MIKYLKSQKGSSSILIILVMVFLISFGIAALSTSLANNRLSDKYEEWNDDFYKVHELAQIMFADIDYAVSKLESSDPNYIVSKKLLCNEGVTSVINDNYVDFSYDVKKNKTSIHVVLRYDTKEKVFYIKDFISKVD